MANFYPIKARNFESKLELVNAIREWGNPCISDAERLAECQRESNGKAYIFIPFKAGKVKFLPSGAVFFNFREKLADGSWGNYKECGNKFAAKFRYTSAAKLYVTDDSGKKNTYLLEQNYSKDRVYSTLNTPFSVAIDIMLGRADIDALLNVLFPSET